MRKFLALACFFGLPLMVSGAEAQQFSADLIMSEGGEQETHKLFVSNSQIRIEMKEDYVLIFDADATWQLNPKFGTYLNLGALPFIVQLIVPQGVERLCRTLQGVSEKERLRDSPWKCRLSGKATLHGRPSVTVTADRAGGEHFNAWIDKKLGVTSKLIVKEPNRPFPEVDELIDIREAPQPASLFAVPADYRRVAGTWLLNKPEGYEEKKSATDDAGPKP